MEREFSTTMFDYGGVRLTPDGLINVAGFGFPQTAGISDSTFGDVTVDKEPGDGKPLKLAFPNGYVLARYEKNQWQIKTDIPEVIESAIKQDWGNQAARRNIPIGCDEYQSPYPVPEPVTMPSSQQRIVTTVVGLLVLIGIIVFGFFFYEEPISRMADAHASLQQMQAADAEARRLQAKQNAEYRALEESIRKAHASATQKLGDLDNASRALSADFQKIVGFSLARLHDHPDDTPREVDESLREDPSFLRAWNQLFNAYLTETKRQIKLATLASIQQKLEARELHDLDRIEIERFLASLDEDGVTLVAQKANLTEVETALAHRRLQNRLSKEERSSP
jgi:hypothetical protein